MKNKLFIIFFFQNIFAQHDIPYDLSNQFGITLNNNQIVWNIDQKFDNLLIDSSSKYFKQKPLSLLYQFDYSKHFENHFLIVSVGYFQTSSSFLFDNLEDNSSNKEFSDFLSFTLIDRFEKGLWNYTFEFNHITKHDKLFLLEELLDNDIDIDRNILKINANNNKNVSIDLSLDNKFYFDLRSLQTIDDILQAYTQNSLHLVNSNSFKSSEIKYGFDYFMGNSPYKNDGS